MSQELTSADFDTKVTNSKGVVLVDFWAVWCPPCKALAPIIQAVAEEAKDKVTVYKLDTDANQDIAMAQGVVSIPTVKIFKDDMELGYIKKIHCRLFHKPNAENLTIEVKALDKNGIIKRLFVKVSQ